MRFLLWFVFVFSFSGGVLRLLYPENGEEERRILYPAIPHGEKVVAIAEIVLAVLLFTKYRCAALYVLATAVFIFTLRVLWTQREHVMQTINKVCTYRGSASAVLLHLMYLAIIVALIGSVC